MRGRQRKHKGEDRREDEFRERVYEGAAERGEVRKKQMGVLRQVI